MNRMTKCALSLAVVVAIAVGGAVLLGWLSVERCDAQLVMVTNPLLQKILATNGWSEVRSNQLFKLVRRFDGEPSTLQLVDAHDIQNALIAEGSWKGDCRLLCSEIVVEDKGVQLRHLVNPKEELRTGKSSYPVWVITDEHAKWLRGWFPDELKVEGCLFSGTKQEPDLKAFVAFFSPTQRAMKIPMDLLMPSPYSFNNDAHCDPIKD